MSSLRVVADHNPSPIPASDEHMEWWDRMKAKHRDRGARGTLIISQASDGTPIVDTYPDAPFALSGLAALLVTPDDDDEVGPA